MIAGQGAPIARTLQSAAAQARSGPVAGYVIYTCSYTPNSAGIGCLYRLCDELNRLGYPSYMTGGLETAPHLNAPLVTTEAARQLCSSGYIAIYPETIPGNPLEARCVVRWVLNRPGLLGGDEVYDDSELVYYYSEAFLPYVQNRIAGKLYMPTIDEQIFYCDDNDLSRRSLECFYIGKSQWQDGLIDRDRVFEITRETPAKRELGKLFRASRVLYCFDNSTILIYEALLCGCPVVVIPDGTQSKADYAQLELGIDGIAWGLEEASDKPVDVEGLRARYRKVEEQFEQQLVAMIEHSQQTAVQRSAITLVRPPAPSLGKRIWTRCRTTWAATRNAGKTVERTIRRGRKRLMRRLLGDRTGKPLPWEEAEHFFCEETDLSKRSLECFYLGQAEGFDGSLERDRVFEITPDMSGAQLGKLLRASRVLYTTERETLLIRRAQSCGCQVELLRGNSPMRARRRKTLQRAEAR